MPVITYHELADELAEEIESLAPGDRLPSENELVASYGVSRISARAALQELERRMLVRRTRGSGTRVALRLAYPLRSGITPSWGQIVREAGHDPTYVVDVIRSERANTAIAATLLIPRGRTVTRVQRRLFVDGEVGACQTHWFPVDEVPDLAEHHAPAGSLAGTLTGHYGIRLDRAWSRAKLAVPTVEIAADLELTGRPPSWRVESVNHCLDRQRPVEYAIAWNRADVFDVMLELGPTDGPHEETR
ncbi:MAG: GntR family transcriptional regulator [Actinomycetota bacterium]